MSANKSITRGVSGEGVQQAPLRIIEGTVANISPRGGRKHHNQDYIQMDTTNILFILCNAFDGIEQTGRMSANKSITRGVSGEGIQQAPLRIIEGTVANISPRGGRKHHNQDYIQMDTTNILFILCNVFDGIEIH